MPYSIDDYCNVFCIRLEFGLPLEDIFPPNDLHPRLKFLLSEAYKRVSEYPISVQQILEQYCGPLENRFETKDNFLTEDCLGFSNSEPPGVYLWILRHFLGLLPIPLLPNYTAGQFFDWQDISEICKQYFVYKNHDYSKTEINYIIARSLCKLPQPNFLLLLALLNLIRKLSINPFCTVQFNRRAVICLGKYFCSAIFVRPFRPGHITQKDKMYHPLMFYMIIKWTDLIQTIKTIADEHYLIKYAPLDEFGICSEVRPFALAEKLHRYTQTEDENETCPYVIVSSHLNNQFLKDISCQTLSSDEILLRLPDSERISCCCSHGSHYDKKFTLNTLTEEEIELKSTTYDNKDDTVLESSPVEFDNFKNCASDKYLFDDYDTFEKEKFNQISMGDHAEEIDLQSKISQTSLTNTSPVNEKQSKSLISPEGNKVLLEKISKIGWRYTPESSPEVTGRLTPKLDIKSSKQFLQTCFENLPEKCCASSSDYAINLNNNPVEQNVVAHKQLFESYLNNSIRSNTCKSDTAIENKFKSDEGNFNSSKGFLKSFKSKFNFIRNLSLNRIAPRDDENYSSNIKYRKMSPKSA